MKRQTIKNLEASITAIGDMHRTKVLHLESLLREEEAKGKVADGVIRQIEKELHSARDEKRDAEYHRDSVRALCLRYFMVLSNPITASDAKLITALQDQITGAVIPHSKPDNSVHPDIFR